ncbi:MAG TPA: TA system VapC family ribonuclease toxin [Conexibacter sp.]|nr:TA system VapC family ribonuclease toxin [Conexibacter sp.]
MGLLDVNALVALAWDSHVHHAAMRAWFRANRDAGWATCPVTEAGFVRVSSNPKVLPAAVSVDAARSVLAAIRGTGEHRFLANDVSPCHADVPPLTGHRQVTDAMLLTLARRNGVRLVTFDAGAATLADGGDVELLGA